MADLINNLNYLTPILLILFTIFGLISGRQKLMEVLVATFIVTLLVKTFGMYFFEDLLSDLFQLLRSDVEDLGFWIRMFEFSLFIVLAVWFGDFTTRSSAKSAYLFSDKFNTIVLAGLSTIFLMTSFMYTLESKHARILEENSDMLRFFYGRYEWVVAVVFFALLFYGFRAQVAAAKAKD